MKSQKIFCLVVLVFFETVSLSKAVIVRRYDPVTGTPSVIWSKPGKPADCSVSGNIVVWADNTNTIYGYNATTGQEFEISTQQKVYELSISGDIVAYMNNTANIYAYNLSTGVEFPICTDPCGQRNPSIDGNIVVWEDKRNGYHTDIYGYDISTGQEFEVLRDDEVWAQMPEVFGDIVVWEHFPYPSGNTKGSICGLNLQTDEFLVVSGSLASRADISDNVVVWDYFGVANNIAGKNLDTGAEFLFESGPDLHYAHPRISGDLIIWKVNDLDEWWVDYRIHGYNFSTGLEFEFDAFIGLNEAFDVDGNIIVYASEPTTPPVEMVFLPGGEFEMGDHHGDSFGLDFDELPVHAVLVDSFFMSKYEITNSQYCDYLNSTYPAELKVVSGVVYAASDGSNSYPYCDTHSADTDSQIDFSDPDFSVRTKGGRDMSDDPMVEVSWYGAVAYCNYNGYRLPTEAEWEYAARGGQHSPYHRYPWGNSIDGSNANHWNSGDQYETGDYPWTTPVGYYDGGQIPAGSDMANGYGLYDMAGNVFEWCNDWYASDYYDTSPYDNPTGPASSGVRVFRGGGWYNRNITYACRVADRVSSNPGTRYHYGGFRIVRDSEPTNSPPVANADGPYSINVGESLTLDGSGSTDPDDDIVSYMWDLDDDGSFETDAGGQAIFDVDYAYLASLGFIAGGPYDIHVQVTDSGQQSDTDSSTLTILAPAVIEVAVDIKPGSCPNPLNVKSKGVLPVAILGSAALDVTTIDAGSIFLNGVPAIRSGYEDVAGFIADANDCECTILGGDGYLDLTLKFMTQDIVATIGEVNHDDVLELQLDGVLSDETPVEGADCVVIRGKHKPINKADINKDGVVNMADVVMVAENWLQSSIVED